MYVKFLFKLIFIPIISIIALPLIVLGLGYKSVSIPIDEFEAVDAMPLSAMVQEELDAFLLGNSTEDTIGLTIEQTNANGLLKDAFLGINENYLDEDADDDQRYYVMKEAYYGYQGSWVEFGDSTVTITSGAHAFVGGFTYKTAVVIGFDISIDTEEVVLKLDKLNIGNLPLAWTFSVASWAAELVTGQDIKGLIDDQLGGLAEFDAQKREVRLSVDEVIERSFEDDPQQKALIQSLIAFVEENELVTIGFEEGIFNARFALGKTRDEVTPIVTIPEVDRIQNDTQLQAILASKVNALIITSIYSPNPFIELDPYTLNRVFEYFIRSAEFAAGVVFESEIYEGYNMRALIPYVTMTDTMKVYIPLEIESATDPLKYFRTVIIIDTTPSVDGNDLLFTLNSLTAGEVTLGQEHIATVLSMLGENEIIRDGAFVLENFDEQMQQSGVSIESVAVVNGNLRLFISLNDTIPLQDIQDAIQDALTNIADNPNYPPELNDAINDILNSVTDPEGDPEAAAEALLEVIAGLDEAEQEELLNDLISSLEESEIDFDEIYNLIP